MKFGLTSDILICTLTPRSLTVAIIDSCHWLRKVHHLLTHLSLLLIILSQMHDKLFKRQSPVPVGAKLLIKEHRIFIKMRFVTLF